METLVIGASTNPERYSYKAIQRLRSYGIQVHALGLKAGTVADVTIQTEKINYPNLHTITLYVNAQRQPEYYNYCLSLQPKRVIFNPGTENPAFYTLLQQAGIQVEVACTLVLLATQQY